MRGVIGEKALVLLCFKSMILLLIFLQKTGKNGKLLSSMSVDEIFHRAGLEGVTIV